MPDIVDTDATDEEAGSDVLPSNEPVSSGERGMCGLSAQQEMSPAQRNAQHADHRMDHHACPSADV